MPVYKNKDATKDGRAWQFRPYYYGVDGIKRQKKSVKYFTKKEAEQAEKEFLTNNNNFKEIEIEDITFEELIISFLEYKKEEVKETTYDTYGDKERYLESIKNIKISEFDIDKFNKWKKEINKTNLAASYKSDIYKFLRNVINYGVNIKDLNFSKIYKKMSNFKDLSSLKKEKLFFTYEEFVKYILVVDDLMFRTLYKILYYFGLRKGELKGLTWEDINFVTKTLDINKQVVNTAKKRNIITSPKTKTSYRNLPFSDKISDDLVELYNKERERHDFNMKDFVFGGKVPLGNSRISSHKNKYCKLAGVKQITIHDFRRSCASLLISQGASPVTVSKFLGHADIAETLNTYSEFFPNDFDKLMEKFDNL